MSPTASQTKAVKAVVAWYFATHWGASSDVGMPAMFMDPSKTGAFAIDPDGYARGDAECLFRLLVACSMFQRLRDQLVLGILKTMLPHRATEVGSARALLKLADDSPCKWTKTTDRLRERCDLQKDAVGEGRCSVSPRTSCHLKTHTVALKRYGHFGKVPTSIALAIREAGALDLADLYQKVLREHADPRARAVALEAALCRAWRVNQKIASMFLSLVCNPDFARGAHGRPAPWSTGVDWSRFVVIDSNVDAFLSSLGYRGSATYDARRDFVTALAARISLRPFAQGVHEFNPRLVQQAMFLFMSKSNRRASPKDCMHGDARGCARCPAALSRRCPVRIAD